MAANTSFRVPCPSCEANVTIRDPGLIGKKVDCPKCKYRFVVEEPEGYEKESPAAEAKKSKGKASAKPAAKKKSGNNTLLIGGVLGVLALAALGVAGWFLFLNGDNTPKPKANVVSTPTNTPVAQNNTPPSGDNPPATPVPPSGDNPPSGENPPTPPTPPTGDTPPATATPNAPTTPETPTPATPTNLSEITNYLPNDCQSVISINMDRLRNSTIGQQAFESRIGFRPDTFKTQFGLGVEEIKSMVRGEHIGQGWTFNVLRTHRPVKLNEFQAPLSLQKGPKSPIRSREYYVIAPNALLDNLSVILQSELDTKDSTAAAKKSNAGPLTLTILDPYTLVIASQEIMEEFLQAGTKFELKSKLASEGDASGGSTPPSGGDRTENRPPQVGRRGVTVGGDAAAPGGEGGGPQFTQRSAYLTIDPHLKAMLDRLEGSGDDRVMSTAMRVQADPKLVNRVRSATGLKEFDPQGMNILGASLQSLSVDTCKGEAGIEFIREATAKEFEDQLKAVLPTAGQILGLYLGGLRINVSGGGGGDGRSGPPSGVGRGSPAAPPVDAGGPPTGAPEDAAGEGSRGGIPGQSGEGAKSSMGLDRKVRTVFFHLDLSLNERAYDRIYALSEGTVVRMKGMVDMAGGVPRWHELAKSTVQLREGGSFPRGTFPRDEGVGAKLSRTFPPNQRVSWMVTLLPFLGYDEIQKSINTKKSWRDDENLKPGSVLIPAFLNAKYPRNTWRAQPPSLGLRDLGATHFVGIAGVGEDAADYAANDPKVAKKIGVFGYDRRTAVKEITDGLANTAIMIQVPPGHQRAWIAGGGATIAGIPEAKPIQPFAMTQANGKRGTYLLMADGSVRFVADTVSEEIFKALCTYKGGEEIADLNAVAPKVDPPKGTELKTSSAGSESKDASAGR